MIRPSGTSCRRPCAQITAFQTPPTHPTHLHTHAGPLLGVAGVAALQVLLSLAALHRQDVAGNLVLAGRARPSKVGGGLVPAGSGGSIRHGWRRQGNVMCSTDSIG